MANLWEGSGQVLVDGETAPSDLARLKASAYRAQWKRNARAKNKEAYAAKQKAYRDARREHLREWHKEDRQKNAERYAEQSRQRYLKQRPYSLVTMAKTRSKKRGYEFNLDEAWVESTWTGRCALTGVEFSSPKKKTDNYSPSLDRIDPSKGYTKDNCRFIIWALNRFKCTSQDEEMIAIARLLISKVDSNG